MKQRIQGAGTELIAVTTQFLNHPQSKDLAFAGMMENVKADEAGVQIVVGIAFVSHRKRKVILTGKLELAPKASSLKTQGQKITAAVTYKRSQLAYHAFPT